VSTATAPATDDWEQRRAEQGQKTGEKFNSLPLTIFMLQFQFVSRFIFSPNRGEKPAGTTRSGETMAAAAIFSAEPWSAHSVRDSHLQRAGFRI
jgi:hypothetical protein